jgi:hypothetical protein
MGQVGGSIISREPIKKLAWPVLLASASVRAGERDPCHEDRTLPLRDSVGISPTSLMACIVEKSIAQANGPACGQVNAIYRCLSSIGTLPVVVIPGRSLHG